MKNKKTELDAIRKSGLFTESEIQRLVNTGAFDPNVKDCGMSDQALKGMEIFAELVGGGGDPELMEVLGGYIKGRRDEIKDA